MRWLVLLALLAALPAGAQEEALPPAQLAAAAKCATPRLLEDFWEASVIELSEELPEDFQKGFRAVMAKAFKPERIQQPVIQWLAKHFTVSELEALSRFTATPAGRTALRKFMSFHALLKPVIEEEVKAAAGPPGGGQ
jgi:hypothetical protein